MFLQPTEANENSLNVTRDFPRRLDRLESELILIKIFYMKISSGFEMSDLVSWIKFVGPML